MHKLNFKMAGAAVAILSAGPSMAASSFTRFPTTYQAAVPSVGRIQSIPSIPSVPSVPTVAVTIPTVPVVPATPTISINPAQTIQLAPTTIGVVTPTRPISPLFMPNVPALHYP
jgi:hypothetical protein